MAKAIERALIDRHRVTNKWRVTDKTEEEAEADSHGDRLDWGARVL
jgi:hypothetical protein